MKHAEYDKKKEENGKIEFTLLWTNVSYILTRFGVLYEVTSSSSLPAATEYERFSFTKHSKRLESGEPRPPARIVVRITHITGRFRSPIIAKFIVLSSAMGGNLTIISFFGLLIASHYNFPKNTLMSWINANKLYTGASATPESIWNACLCQHFVHCHAGLAKVLCPHRTPEPYCCDKLAVCECATSPPKRLRPKVWS